MQSAECKVGGVTYRKVLAKANQEECEGCAGEHNSDICLHLGKCGSFDGEDGNGDYIWKKVEKYVDKKLKKK